MDQNACLTPIKLHCFDALTQTLYASLSEREFENCVATIGTEEEESVTNKLISI